MTRFLCSLIFFLFLASAELSFVYALPFPMDRFPLVLCVSVFVFQSLDIRQALWWIVGQGFLLDLLRISFVSFEIVSYAVVSIVVFLTARHVFSNRSYWGMLGTLTISLVVLLGIEMAIAVLMGFWGSYQVPVQTMVSVRTWGWGLSVAALLFLFPMHDFFSRIRGTLLKA